MIRKQKEAIINELAGSLGKCVVAVATDYRGMTAKEMVQLRKQMHQQGVEYKVVKNTLMHFAAEKAGMKGLDQFLTGPMAIAISYDDAVKPAKILVEHIKAANSVLKVKGGVLGDKVLTPADVISLAATPSKGSADQPVAGPPEITCIRSSLCAQFTAARAGRSTAGKGQAARGCLKQAITG